MSAPLLSVQSLRVTFAPAAPGQPPARVVDGVSFTLAAGGSLAVV